MNVIELLNAANISYDQKEQDGCIEYVGCKTKSGYGQFHKECMYWTAHRYVWTLVNGPIPKGMCVCHKCDNPPCMNPDHLFLGTSKDNHQDKTRKGRNPQKQKTHCPRGHEYTKENTYSYPSKPTHRTCRTCRDRRNRERYFRTF